MQAFELRGSEGLEDCGCADGSPGIFRQTIDDREKSWAAEARRAPYFPFVAWT
jgi:hypothetical protein